MVDARQEGLHDAKARNLQRLKTVVQHLLALKVYRLQPKAPVSSGGSCTAVHKGPGTPFRTSHPTHPCRLRTLCCVVVDVRPRYRCRHPHPSPS